MYNMYVSQSNRQQQWCGYQARARAIGHLKPHPTPAYDHHPLRGADDEDGDEANHDDATWMDGHGTPLMLPHFTEESEGTPEYFCGLGF